MKRKIAMLLLATVSAMLAFGAYKVEPRLNFYFENEGEADPYNPRQWADYTWYDLSGPIESTLSKSGDSCSYSAKMLSDYKTVKDWGLTTELGVFTDISWTGTSSTNFTHTYDSKYENSGTLYLHLWLRWYRYSLSFESNGGGDVSAVDDICYTNSVTLPMLSLTGYTFNGWTNSYNKTALNGDISGSDVAADVDGTNITLYAKWTANTYPVTFDANGGTVSPTSMSVTYDSVYGELPTPTRTGHTFEGWFTERVEGEQVVSGDMVKITSAQTLYARWTVNTYTVTFDPDGGHVSPSSVRIAYGSSYGSLPVPVREYHDFVGWYTAKDGGDPVEAADIMSTASDHALYAHWTSKMFKVVFYGTDNNVFREEEMPAGTEFTIPGAPAVSEGESFIGWKCDSVTYPAGVQINVERHMVFFPETKKVTPKITYSVNPQDSGYVEIVEGSADGDYGRSVKLAAVPADAYTFAGWSDGVVTLTNTVTVKSSTNLVANFTMKTNTVEFIGWGGESLKIEEVRYGEAATAPEVDVLTGISFMGWDPADFSEVISNMTITALYETNTYTVVYDPNGGGGHMAEDVFAYGVEYQLQSNSFDRSTYWFVGWSTNPDAETNEVEYVDGATVSNLTATANGTNTLYAVWSSSLTRYSEAADCTNLVLECNHPTLGKWSVDGSFGYKSSSSLFSSGDDWSVMTASIKGAGTLTFRLRVYSPAAENRKIKDVFLFQNDKGETMLDDGTHIWESLPGGEWRICTYTKTASDAMTYTWLHKPKTKDDYAYIDQVHWYPDEMVEMTSAASGSISVEKRNEIRESLLFNWHNILGGCQCDVEKMVVDLSNLMLGNAIPLLNLGFSPAYTVDESTATASVTFTNAPEIAISDIDVGELPDVGMTACVTNTSIGLPKWSDGVDQALSVWGAPTPTSAWSKVESACDLSSYLTDGSAVFSFEAGTNRFFKVKAE